MDNNTKDVLMAVLGIVSIFVSGLVAILVAKNNAKLGQYRKEVNGHMSTLIETTKQLGESVGRQHEQEDELKRKNKE